MTAEKYLDVCGYKIDYNYFYDNIKFFYEYGRGKCRVHIKTVDMALDDGEDALFFNTFKAYCDTINIDRIVPVFQGVDYENIMNEKEKFTVSRYEEVKSRTCEKIFYTLFVLADGTIAPCCDSPQPLTYGNIQDISLLQAWNGDRRRDFMIKHLKGMRCENSVCANCYVPLLDKCPQDILDGYEKVILKKI